MRFIVVGAGFTNKGAEAMTLTVKAELEKRLPGVELAFWNCPPAQAGISRANGITPILSPSRGGKGARFAWLGRQALKTGRFSAAHFTDPAQAWRVATTRQMLAEVGDFDGIIDIAGFAYGDDWGPGPLLALGPLLDAAEKRGLPTVFMPQAWGRFERPEVEKALLEVFAHPRVRAYSRDERSHRHLISAGVPESLVKPHGDIVFAFEGAGPERGRELLTAWGCSLTRPVLAIAPNMRAYERSEGTGAESAYVRTLVALADHAIARHDVDVILLPAECSPVDTGRDDRVLCELIRGAVAQADRCHFDAAYLSAPDFWAMVGASEYLIPSRFHALVFGLTQGVPATVLGWSHKYTELMRAFGEDAHCVDHEKVGAEAAVDLFEAGWLVRTERRTAILAVAASLKAEAAALFDEVAETLAPEATRAGGASAASASDATRAGGTASTGAAEAAPRPSRSVRDIAESRLCCSCGACVAVCPEGAISMRETPAGLLLASVDPELCTDCGICRGVCPGLGIDVPAGDDQFAGEIRSAWIAHATDPAMRAGGQSGGLIGALLKRLFENGEITGFLGVMASEDGSLVPVPGIIRSAEEIGRAQGSKYRPVALDSALRDVRPDDRLAFVGVSCQLHGLEKMIARRRIDPERIALRIGLFCDRVMTGAAVDVIAEDLSVEPATATRFDYRSKERNGWPGEVCFTRTDGTKTFGPATIRQSVKDYATPERCRVCFDKLDVFADISVGDAWGSSENRLGDSVALVRTELGERVIAEACDAGAIGTAPVDVAEVLAHAGLAARKASFAGFSAVRREQGLPLPEFGGLVQPPAPSGTELARFRAVAAGDAHVATSATRAEAVSRIKARRKAEAGSKAAGKFVARVKRQLRRLIPGR